MPAVFTGINGFHAISKETGNPFGIDFFGYETYATGFHYQRQANGSWVSLAQGDNEFRVIAILSDETIIPNGDDPQYELTVIGLRYERIVNGVATHVGTLSIPPVMVSGGSIITLGYDVSVKVNEIGLEFNGSNGIDVFDPKDYGPIFETNATFNMGGGNDIVYTQNHYADIVNGGDGDDYISAENGNNVITGGAGSDLVIVGVGDDDVRMGDGDDRFVYEDGSIDVAADLGEGEDYYEGGRGSDCASGSWGDDTMWGNTAAANGLLLAASGDGGDILYGNGGNDILYGNQGDDQLYGGSENDIIYGGRQSDYIEGGGENDVLYGDTSVNDEREAGNDIILGDFGDDKLYGGGGSDTLYGGEDKDILNGGSGDDALDGGNGDDTYYVDSVGDTVYEYFFSGNDVVISTGTFDLRPEGGEIELLRLTSTTSTANYNLTGSDFNNTLLANAGNNILDGGAGADSLRGLTGDDQYYVDTLSDAVIEANGGGRDVVLASANYTLRANQEIEILRANAGNTGLTLTGNEFANTIVGGAGADRLGGGLGTDYLTGGNGIDIFVFRTLADSGLGAARDVIADFVKGTDRINLLGIDANTTAGATGDQAFTLITGAFTGQAGQLHQVTANGNTIVEGDVDGNRVADFQILLKGVHTLQATDFVL